MKDRPSDWACHLHASRSFLREKDFFWYLHGRHVCTPRRGCERGRVLSNTPSPRTLSRTQRHASRKGITRLPEDEIPTNLD